MISGAELDRIACVLDGCAGLDALWIFGSEASSSARRDSDIDLAALFATKPAAQRYLDAVGEISAMLGREVDVVDLEEASPFLAMQVIRKGRLLFEKGRRHRIAFEASLPGSYDDVVRMRREVERRLVERMQP